MNAIFYLMVSSWILSSLIGIPAFASLIFSTFLVNSIIKLEDKKRESLLYIFFLASLIFSYLLYFEIYPYNVSLLISIVASSIFLSTFKNLKKLEIKINKYSSENYFYLTILILILVIGSILSLNIGLSWDEGIEQDNFLRSLQALSHALKGSQEYYQFNTWADRYYGIGFYLPTYWINKPFASLISSYFSVDIKTGILLSRHLVIFWLFFLSSFIVLKIVKLLTGSFRYAFLISVFYLLYPYLLGHGMMNGKDTPFSVAWLLSTYYSLQLIKQFSVDKIISETLLAKLIFSISWLISIRLSGFLFSVPILIIIIYIVFSSFNNKIKYKNIINVNYLIFILFISVSLIVTSYPIFWQNPLEILRGILYMSNHPWTGCTLTFGLCTSGNKISLLYIPAWLIVKLPIITIIGIISIPIFMVYKSKSPYENQAPLISYLIISTLTVLATLIFIKVHLYDELRQILFIVPILIIIGATTIYSISKKASYVAILLTIFLFISDNFKIFPYQYSWFNEISRFFNVNEKYEKDYWGISLRSMAKKLNTNSLILSNTTINCIESNPKHLFLPFLNGSQMKNCLDPASRISSFNNISPYIYVGYIKGGINNPINCKLLYQEKFQLTGSNNLITVGNILNCD
jgi:hypothetical protein